MSDLVGTQIVGFLTHRLSLFYFARQCLYLTLQFFFFFFFFFFAGHLSDRMIFFAGQNEILLVLSERPAFLCRLTLAEKTI